MEEAKGRQNKANKNIIGMAVVAIITIIGFMVIVSQLFYKVDEHELGVIVNNGEITGMIEPGISVKTPFISNVVKIPNTLQERERKGVSAASKDNYNVKDSVISYSYRIPRDSVIEVYRNFPNYESILDNEFNSAAKNILGQYRMLKIPEKRAEIGEKIRERVEEKVGDKTGINILSADIAGYSWDNEARTYLRSVKSAEQEQDVEREKLKTVEINNNRKDRKQESEINRQREKQKAENERMIEKAEAKAKAEIIEREAEADGMKVIAEVISKHPELLERQRLDQWDGKMPIVQGENSTRVDLRAQDLKN